MKRNLALILTLVLIVSMALTGCGGHTAEEPPVQTPAPAVEPTPAPATPTPAPEPTPEAPAQRVKVNFAVLSGPTGVGAAKLLAEAEAGTTANDYTVSVESDNSAVTTKLVNGEYDIAALATNVASNLYNKTGGKIQIAAINTLGVLYILGKDVASGQAVDANGNMYVWGDNDGNITSLASLKGRTLYAFGQGANPEYVLNYLLRENGVEPGEVDIQWKAAADEVTAAMLQAEGEALCMLPVPAATALVAKSEGSIQPVFSLSDEWDALHNGSRLTMGCIVVRTAFAQEHPEAVDAFLKEYGASIDYMNDPANTADAAELVAGYGLAPSAGIAAKAIPQCNLVCYTGAEIKKSIQGYYEALFAADASSIGGAVPGDDFYYVGK